MISFRRCGDYASGTNHTLRESLLHVNCLFRAVLTVSSIDSHRRIRQAVLGRLDVLLPQALHLARAHFGRLETIGSLRRDPRRRGAARRSQGECQFASRKDRARRLVDKRAPPSERVAKAHIESHTTGRLVSLHMGTLVLVSSVHQGLDCGIFLVEPLHFVGSVSSGNRIGRHEHAHLPSRLRRGLQACRSYERDCVCSVTAGQYQFPPARRYIQSCMLR